jgi:hypothetical protein
VKGATVPIPFSRWRMRADLAGVLVGVFAHAPTGAVFIFSWILQRVSAPTCFPDEDGVMGSLVCSLLVGLVTSIVVVFGVARRTGDARQRFLTSALAGWVLGVILIVLAAMEVVAFVDTLGAGCGGSTRTPWNWR